MSDKRRQGKQEQPLEPTPAVGEKWGDAITPERQADLSGADLSGANLGWVHQLHNTW
jgi:uncharacterized protein YjbI with pentapeptide repeats